MRTTKEHIAQTTDLDATGAVLPPIIETGTKLQISSELSLALNKLHTHPDEREIIEKEVINSAKELAAVVLPKERCEEIGIKPAVADSQSVYHPPLRQDVIKIAYALEATNDVQLSMALVDAIEELPDDLRDNCAEALEVSLSTNVPFEEALLELEARSDSFTSVATGSRAVAFMDRVSMDMLLDTDINHADPYSEDMERLVHPIATGWLNGRKDEHAHIPHIVFGHPNRDDGSRQAGFYSGDKDS